MQFSKKNSKYQIYFKKKPLIEISGFLICDTPAAPKDIQI
jgi:hypothetical protein